MEAADMKITLTVPYAGTDRSISGTPSAIAAAAALVARGLPTLAEMNLTQDLADVDEGTAGASMGIGTGGGREFVEGSHTLLMALQRVITRPRPRPTAERHVSASI